MDSSPFDRAALENIGRQLGHEKLCEVIELFLEHAPGRVGRVLEGETTGDLAASADALHSIKSSAAMLGAVELLGVAETLERMARADEREAFTSRLGDLGRALKRAEQFLREHMKGPDG